MPPSLKVAERMFVWTALGEREIQLCFGDITALPMEDKVDFVMVSCFRGDYSPMRGTVLGALYHNLGISVQEMAKNKKEDLRKKFHCWISQNLDSHHPYRQLLCFERMYNDLTAAVKEIFRAMMPAFNNTNKSVITPLLATGHQGADETEMLSTIVKTAAEWMWLGMPLQTFKVVLYCANPERPNDVSWKSLDTFKKLKAKLERVKIIPQEPAIVEDVFLIFSEKETELATSFIDNLRKVNKSLKIKTVKDMQFKEDSWQHDLFNFIQTVARVVPLLTTQFLSEGSCIDQFNVAVCCNRLTKRHLLAPVLLERLELPSYVNLLQWINCRDMTEEQLEEASFTLSEQVRTGNAPPKSKYDVFISYCHKNLPVAKQLLEGLEKLTPKPNVFFDFEQLTTGVAWQETLYQAIDNTRCMVALLSPAYMQSAVCQEEINLALVKHLGKNKTLELVPLRICDLPSPEPSLCQYVKPVSLEGDTTIDTVCAQLGRWLATGESPDIFRPVSEPLNYDRLCSKVRQNQFEELYRYVNYTVEIKTPMSSYPPLQDTRGDVPCDVYISHSVRDQRFATFLMEYLQTRQPKLKVFDKTTSVTNRGALLDSAWCIVVLLSPAYINSMHEAEEFSVILGRVRQTKSRRLMYVFKTDDLTKGPTYFSIVPCDTSLMDDVWWVLGKDQPKVRDKHKSILEVVKKKSSAIKAMELCPLLKVACDLERILQCGRYLPNIRHQDVNLDSIVNAHIAAEMTPQAHVEQVIESVGTRPKAPASTDSRDQETGERISTGVTVENQGPVHVDEDSEAGKSDTRHEPALEELKVETGHTDDTQSSVNTEVVKTKEQESTEQFSGTRDEQFSGTGDEQVLGTGDEQVSATRDDGRTSREAELTPAAEGEPASDTQGASSQSEGPEKNTLVAGGRDDATQDESHNLRGVGDQKSNTALEKSKSGKSKLCSIL